jgi:trehalose/maltose hydrolase-like predicted phosphorylase
VHEQFAGYWDLEPLVADIAPRPYAADMLLGPERVAGSQLLKQPDVLMLHHMVPEELPDGSLGPALHVYEPRTTHGSSLSPGIVAGLLARAGRPDDAVEAFAIAAGLDLHDLTGTTAGGLHLATMGALWQALAGGFAGIRPHGDVLVVEPSLPSRWTTLTVRLVFQGIHLAVTVGHDDVGVACDAPVRIRTGTRPPVLCHPPGARYTLTTRRADEER